MRRFALEPTGIVFRPDAGRVLVRSFIPADPERVLSIIRRAEQLTEAETERRVTRLLADFGNRHVDIRALWHRHFEQVAKQVSLGDRPSFARQMYIGALFSGEYALESAALFNPSIVPHPDQSNLGAGELRFILSLRATGEGHISSIEFRAGLIRADNSIVLEPPTQYVIAPETNPNPTFRKDIFHRKLKEMGFGNDWSGGMMAPLRERFTLSELEEAILRATQGTDPLPREIQRTMECVKWLALSNYEIHFRPTQAISERVIFPVSSNESNGMEDARFVRFVEEDGEVTYYATYTAYNGRAILPQLIETTDFLNFRVLTLNGKAIQNKGMALFPRRIGGQYAMISRQDDENLFLMFSENPHFWSDPQLLSRPASDWEATKIGNCGSPIETDAGWLVITHGVGPMRRYCLGAMLLDRDDPSKVLGRLREPLLEPADNARLGYVPNVVYTCGALLHAGRLVLPYGLCDTTVAITTVDVAALISAILEDGV
jgi:predicted GH43/DUF377 family glycosyl hydrolase